MKKIELTKKQKLLLAACGGILILIVVWPVSKGGKDETPVSQPTAASSSEGTSLENYVAAQERRLKNIVEKIEGAGKVQVMITAKASKELVVEKDKNVTSQDIDETDSSGGARKTKEYTSNEASVTGTGSSGQQNPYVIKELEPQIEGVVVVASGADNIEVVDAITNTVSVLYNVPLHKIKVVKMNS